MAVIQAKTSTIFLITWFLMKKVTIRITTNKAINDKNTRTSWAGNSKAERILSEINSSK
jgi:hypothetical protein